MKRIRAILCLLLTASLLIFAGFSAPNVNEPIGAKAAKLDTSLTLGDMLTYAMQDNYLARARYEQVVEKFGQQRPFTDIIAAEITHIAHLKPLFSKYKTAIPADNAKSYVKVPKTMRESFTAGVRGEVDNIEMYDRFLKQDMPDDVRTVFKALRNVSLNHLKAFQQGLLKFQSM
ncbi:MAG: DUF2202 domain-containing protein [Caulobacteraceae bacterium]